MPFRNVNTIRFVTLSIKVWGAETTLMTLVRSLKVIAPDIELQLAAPPGEMTELWRKEEIGPIFALAAKYGSLQGHRSLLASQVSLRRHLARLPTVDVIHSHHQWSHLPVAAAGRGRRSVLDLHDFVPTRAGRLIQAAAVLFASHVFTASETVRRQLPAGLHRSTQILNRPVAAGPQLQAKTVAKMHGMLSVIIVCRPDPNKQLFTALEPLLKALHSEDKVVVVGGERAEYGPMPPQVATDGRLAFTGRLTGALLTAEWQKANVHLLSSASEPFGRVVVEAASHGLPSIVHELAGAADVVRKTGGGVVVSDWAEVGEAVRVIREQAWWTGLSSSLEQIQEAHSPHGVAEQYIESIRK